MNIIRAVITVFSLLIVSQGFTNTQNSMKVLLKEGYENLPIQIGNITVKVARLHTIQRENYCEISAELNISENGRQYNTSLYYLKAETDGLNENYPKAFDKYLFGLEVNDSDTEAKPEVTLTIEQNNFGKPFFLELNQETVIDGLAVHFNYYSRKWKVPYYQDESEYEVILGEIKLSENGEEEIILYDSDDRNEKGESISVFEWKDYRICVLDYKDDLKLRVTKSE